MKMFETRTMPDENEQSESKTTVTMIPGGWFFKTTFVRSYESVSVHTVFLQDLGHAFANLYSELPKPD